MDRISRNFLWGSTETKKKVHLISWKKITRPKKEGGLGIQAAKEKNIALLAKLNWRLHSENTSIWARVLNQKYRSPRRITNLGSRFRPCSTTWAAIRKGESVFNKGIKWIVGRESNLSLWHDKWLDKGTLRSQIAGPLTRGEEEALVKDVVSFSGWNWQGFSFSFPYSLKLEIKATPIPFVTSNADCITWSSSPSGDFDIKEAYKLASVETQGWSPATFNGEWIWKVRTIPKIQCFIWQCIHQSIPVRSVLASRGMNIPEMCPLCSDGPETIAHALRDCREAQHFWRSLLPPPFLLRFSSGLTLRFG